MLAFILNLRTFPGCRVAIIPGNDVSPDAGPPPLRSPLPEMSSIGRAVRPVRPVNESHPPPAA